MSLRGFSMIVLLVLAVAAGAAVWVRCEGTPPELDAPEELAVGRDGKTVTVTARDPGSGVRNLSARLRHAGGEVPLGDTQTMGTLLVGGEAAEPATLEVTVDPKGLGLREGQAFLVLEAADWSWRRLLQGNLAVREVPLAVDLSPPRISVRSGLTYVHRGGAGAVVYSVDEGAARDGVAVADAFFPGHSHPNDPSLRVALFAVPRDAPESPRVRVVAEDAAGNTASAGWPVHVKERRFDDVPIRLSQRFMEGKVRELAEILDVDASEPVPAFQHINREVRAANEARIREIVQDVESERLFEGPFVQLENSAVTSRFAEHRTYFLEGEKISEAIHYGYDLASLAGAPIHASNTGRVIHAEPLGIYGNTVILDHGLGLASLYAHLSRVDVAPGDRVEKGQVLGLSGETGLAGGDHLHFAVLVGGVYVDPKEWWDPKWVRTHVDERLAPPESAQASAP